VPLAQERFKHCRSPSHAPCQGACQSACPGFHVCQHPRTCRRWCEGQECASQASSKKEAWQGMEGGRQTLDARRTLHVPAARSMANTPTRAPCDTRTIQTRQAKTRAPRKLGTPKHPTIDQRRIRHGVHAQPDKPFLSIRLCTPKHKCWREWRRPTDRGVGAVARPPVPCARPTLPRATGRVSENINSAECNWWREGGRSARSARLLSRLLTSLVV
jgi:hypothetical protein